MSNLRLRKALFEGSRSFILESARPLEIALFHYLFESGATDRVLEALGHNQNEDGGFGHALEPDLRSPESSALCTSIAFQTLRLVGARYTHPMVASGIRYLIDTLIWKMYSGR